LIAGIHRPSLLVAQPLIVLPDPEKPATNDLFAAEQQFAPVEKSQSLCGELDVRHEPHTVEVWKLRPFSVPKLGPRAALIHSKIVRFGKLTGRPQIHSDLVTQFAHTGLALSRYRISAIRTISTATSVICVSSLTPSPSCQALNAVSVFGPSWIDKDSFASLDPPEVVTNP
jgi:hypothetical protein